MPQSTAFQQLYSPERRSMSLWANRGYGPTVSSKRDCSQNMNCIDTHTYTTNSPMCSIYSKPTLEVIVLLWIFFFSTFTEQQTADGQLQLFYCSLTDVLAEDKSLRFYCGLNWKESVWRSSGSFSTGEHMINHLWPRTRGPWPHVALSSVLFIVLRDTHHPTLTLNHTHTHTLPHLSTSTYPPPSPPPLLSPSHAGPTGTEGMCDSWHLSRWISTSF